MREIIIDLWRSSRFNMGYVGENDATKLIFQLTPDLQGADFYVIEFFVDGKVKRVEGIEPQDGALPYVVSADLIKAEGDIAMQVWAGIDDTIIKSPIVYGRVNKIEDNSCTPPSSCSHSNQKVLDKLGENNKGELTFNNSPVGGASGYAVGNGLVVRDGMLSVDAATSVERDNTKPITSAAVYTEVGNINALLATI